MRGVDDRVIHAILPRTPKAVYILGLGTLFENPVRECKGNIRSILRNLLGVHPQGSKFDSLNLRSQEKKDASFLGLLDDPHNSDLTGFCFNAST